MVSKLNIRQNLHLSREELDIYRLKLLKNQLRKAYKNIPFYKNTFDQFDVNPSKLKSINDLSIYPIITKEIVRSNNLNNHKLFFRNKLKSHTSGSTGQPMWTYYNLESWIRKKYLVKARARMECGLKLFDKIALFESAAKNYKQNGNFLFRNFNSHYKMFSIFETNDNIVQKLIEFSPKALYGFPSYLFQLGQFIVKNNYKFNQVKEIFTSSEYLQDNMRKYIENSFNAEVFDIYGSTEFKEVAWECEKHEGYHINEDEVIIEILNEGKTVEYGEVGNIVITDLRNTTMPLIRYQMYDKGILLKEKCSCGRTFSLMRPYAGRSSEYIILPNNEILSPYLFTTSIEKIDGLQQYQIIQAGETKLSANVVCSRENFSRIVVALKDILSRITNCKMEIKIERKTFINVEKNGKFKVVRNLLLEQKDIKI